ncbi:MFS transporter [Brevundimonas sp.]|uniref:MFS transporter n=1 Tax=Brevundimonas sp. TaxID=1871086 RepID=UPI002FCADAB9
MKVLAGSAGGETRRQGWLFLALYALCYAGGVIAYVPLLTFLLPIKVEELALADKVALLSLATLAGALVASVANILAGILSDISVRRGGGRRPWVIGGMIATLASYGVLHLCRTPASLIGGVILFQFALNFMIAPLMAIAADEVPDSQKGLLGGLFAAAYPLGALAGIVVTAFPRLAEGGQFLVVGGLVLAMTLPFLVVMRRPAMIREAESASPDRRRVGRGNLALVWVARLLVQIAGSILFAYFLFYFETVDREGLALASRELAGKISWLSGASAILSVLLGVVIGRLSDTSGARKPLLAATVAMLTAGLLIMALMPQWAPAAIGYVLFSCGVGAFLAVQATYAMHLLPSPLHRGRDLGVLNLTNTIPALAAPALAVALVKVDDFGPLLLILALLTALAGVLILMIRDETPDLPVAGDRAAPAPDERRTGKFHLRQA